MEKTAEQAWKDNAFNLGHSTDYVRGISDYKQALRQAIEERKKFVEECLPPDAHFDARKKGALHEIEKLLQLLDTVKPLNP